MGEPRLSEWDPDDKMIYLFDIKKEELFTWLMAWVYCMSVLLLQVAGGPGSRMEGRERWVAQAICSFMLGPPFPKSATCTCCNCIEKNGVFSIH